MKKIIILSILVLSLCITPTAFACKPAGNYPPTMQENIAQKDIVFSGTVQSVIQDKSVNSEYRITFAVHQAYKGTLGESVVVRAQSSSAACGYDQGYDTFAIGSVWVIAADGTAVNGYSTNSISANTSYVSVALADAAMVAAGVAIPVLESPVMCTMQYAPVCGKRDTHIRCITTPCNSFEIKTYGNACMLEADKAVALYQGECQSENTNTVSVSGQVTTATTDAPTLDTQIETSVVAGVTPTHTWWQKITLRFQSLFSFLKK